MNHMSAAAHQPAHHNVSTEGANTHLAAGITPGPNGASHVSFPGGHYPVAGMKVPANDLNAIRQTNLLSMKDAVSPNAPTINAAAGGLPQELVDALAKHAANQNHQQHAHTTHHGGKWVNHVTQQSHGHGGHGPGV